MLRLLVVSWINCGKGVAGCAIQSSNVGRVRWYSHDIQNLDPRSKREQTL